METLAIIAYHQPVTRAEVEEIRGVALSKGTLDILLEIGWVRPRGRRRTPGRPVTWGTTTEFLDHFGLSSLDDLPGFEELKAAGLIDARPAVVAMGQHGKLLNAEEAAAQQEEEDPLEEGDDPLRADFGDDLVPEDEEGADGDPETAADEDVAEGDDRPEDGAADEAADETGDDESAAKDRSVAALQAELKEALGG